MEGDDEADHLALSPQQTFRIIAISSLVFMATLATAVDLANEAWSHGGSAEDVQMSRSFILEVLLSNILSNHDAITSVDLGYHFL